MNETHLIGRLVKEPTFVAYDSGKKKVSFTVAVNSYQYGGKTKAKANFIPCEAWDKTAEIISKLGEKGALISISGSLLQQSFKDKNGSHVNRLSVLVSKFQKLSSPAQKLEQEASAYDMESSISTINSYEQNGVFQENYTDEIEIGNDELPF